MIRINLLARPPNRGGRLQALLQPRGRSAFITRKEFVLAAVMLASGAAIHYSQFQRETSAEDAPPPLAQSQPPEAPAYPVPQQPPPEPGAAPPQPAAAGPGPGPAEPPARSSEPSEEPVAQAPPPGQNVPPEQESSHPEQEPTSPPAVEESVFTAVEVSDIAGLLTILLEGGGEAEFSTFRLDEPKRLVVDLEPARLRLAGGNYVKDMRHPIVQRVRVAQNRFSPPRVRLVLDLHEFTRVSVLRSGQGIAIQVASE